VQKEAKYTPLPGTTRWKKEDVRKLVISEEVKAAAASTAAAGGDSMEVDRD
jgi:hypothetical protein